MIWIRFLSPNGKPVLLNAGRLASIGLDFDKKSERHELLAYDSGDEGGYWVLYQADKVEWAVAVADALGEAMRDAMCQYTGCGFIDLPRVVAARGAPAVSPPRDDTRCACANYEAAEQEGTT